MNKALKYQRLTVAWALFIFMLCTIKLGGVGNSRLFFAGFDKLVHCGLFFVLTVFLASGFLNSNRGHGLTLLQVCLSFLVSAIYGGAIELLQLYVFTWRSGEWGDFFADSVGASMAIFGVLITLWSIKK